MTSEGSEGAAGWTDAPEDRVPIRTARLDLHLLPVEDVIRLFENPEDPAPWTDRPYRNPHRVLVDDLGPLPYRVVQVRADPSQNRWLVRLMVLRETGEIVGGIGFHGPPDEAGMLEIGLEVVPAFRNRGIAKEALVGLWRWGCAQPGVRTLRYSVSPANAPSIAVVESFGFRRVGLQMDEEDGPEYVYELPVGEFLARYGDPLPAEGRPAR